MPIDTIEIENFKSIRKQSVTITPINVLIGSNGAGKSNFISFFKFLNRLYEQQLQVYIGRHGRAENFSYFGRKVSDFIAGRMVFNNDRKNEYFFKIVPDQSGNFIFSEEWSNYTKPGTTKNEVKNYYRRQY